MREDYRADRRTFVDTLGSYGKDRLSAPAVRKAPSEGYLDPARRDTGVFSAGPGCWPSAGGRGWRTDWHQRLCFLDR
ncbi:hypothetical protein ACRAWD_18185 [Caulobacter segnis]